MDPKYRFCEALGFLLAQLVVPGEPSNTLQRYIAQQRQDGLAWVMPLRGYTLAEVTATWRRLSAAQQDACREPYERFQQALGEAHRRLEAAAFAANQCLRDLDVRELTLPRAGSLTVAQLNGMIIFRESEAAEDISLEEVKQAFEDMLSNRMPADVVRRMIERAEAEARSAEASGEQPEPPMTLDEVEHLIEKVEEIARENGWQGETFGGEEATADLAAAGEAPGARDRGGAGSRDDAPSAQVTESITESITEPTSPPIEGAARAAARRWPRPLMAAAAAAVVIGGLLFARLWPETGVASEPAAVCYPVPTALTAALPRGGAEPSPRAHVPTAPAQQPNHTVPERPIAHITAMGSYRKVSTNK